MVFVKSKLSAKAGFSWSHPEVFIFVILTVVVGTPHRLRWNMHSTLLRNSFLLKMVILYRSYAIFVQSSVSLHFAVCWYCNSLFYFNKLGSWVAGLGFQFYFLIIHCCYLFSVLHKTLKCSCPTVVQMLVLGGV